MVPGGRLKFYGTVITNPSPGLCYRLTASADTNCRTLTMLYHSCLLTCGELQYNCTSTGMILDLVELYTVHRSGESRLQHNLPNNQTRVDLGVCDTCGLTPANLPKKRNSSSRSYSTPYQCLYVDVGVPIHHGAPKTNRQRTNLPFIHQNENVGTK